MKEGEREGREEEEITSERERERMIHACAGKGVTTINAMEDGFNRKRDEERDIVGNMYVGGRG